MVSSTYFLAAISAVAGLAAASPAHHGVNMHRRRQYYGFNNGTAVEVSPSPVVSIPLTTGTPSGEVKPVEVPTESKPVDIYNPIYNPPVVEESSAVTPGEAEITPAPVPVSTAIYETTTTSYVTVTYTLGDGRAITKTITKEIPCTVTVTGTDAETVPRQTSTSTTTVNITLPAEEAPAATVAPAAPSVDDGKFTATVYETKTHTGVKVIYSTRPAPSNTPVAEPVYSPVAAPIYTPSAILPPWSNGTSPDTTTTINVSITTTIPHPTATGGAPIYGY